MLSGRNWCVARIASSSVERHPPDLGDLAVGKGERTVVDDAVPATDGRQVVVDVPAVAQQFQSDVDYAKLLGQLAAGSVFVRLTGSDDTAGGDVPPARPDVLGVAAPVDQQPAIGGHDGNRRPSGAAAGRPASRRG